MKSDEQRLADRQAANARLIGLTVAEYLALPRPVRKRRVQAARADAPNSGDGR